MLLRCESLERLMSQLGHSRRIGALAPRAAYRLRAESGQFGRPSRQVRLVPRLDHLVGAREERRWHVEAERLGCLHIDDQLESARLHHREVGGGSRP